MKRLDYGVNYKMSEEIVSGLREGDVVTVMDQDRTMTYGLVYEIHQDREIKMISTSGDKFAIDIPLAENMGYLIHLEVNHWPIRREGKIWIWDDSRKNP